MHSFVLRALDILTIVSIVKFASPFNILVMYAGEQPMFAANADFEIFSFVIAV